LEIPTDILDSALKSPKKFKELLKELSLMLNSTSSQLEEDIGVTKSVNHIPSQLKLQENAVQSDLDLSQPQEVLVSLLVVHQRKSYN